MVSKVRNFWLCVFSGVVATTLILRIINWHKMCVKSDNFVKSLCEKSEILSKHFGILTLKFLTFFLTVQLSHQNNGR